MTFLISLQSSSKLKDIANILKAPSMIILWEKYLFRALTTLANIFRNVVHGCLRGSYLVYLIITLLWFNLRASLLSLRLAKKLQTPNCGVYSAILKHKIWLHILPLTMLPINCECYNF